MNSEKKIIVSHRHDDSESRRIPQVRFQIIFLRSVVLSFPKHLLTPAYRVSSLTLILVAASLRFHLPSIRTIDAARKKGAHRTYFFRSDT